ncbi:MAG TPA: hypothetical protein VJ327_11300 [Patescibacteria group bacterium]|nr:hypothetical protein [Patescibacteria group bacterium]
MQLNDFELHNMQLDQGQLAVRDGWRRVVSGLGDITYGFSIESPNTSEVYHYLVKRSADGDGYIQAYEEDFNSLYQLSIGKIPVDCPIYYGVQNRQLLINSPYMNYPVYGIVGGGLTQAIKTDSINLDTTTLNIPTGIMCQFGDRFCVAQGSILYFNDPGIDPRSFTAENAISLPSQVYHLEQTSEGMLAVFCATGIYTLPKDALGQGQNVVGFIGTEPGYEAIDFRCAASGNGVTIGLVHDGIAVAQQGMELFPLKAYHQKRYFTDYVAPEDFRGGRAYKTINGFIISYTHHNLLIDIKNQYISWNYNDSRTTIRGTLRTQDGHDLFIMSDGSVAYPRGTADDYNSNDVDGYACGVLATTPANSTMIRSATLTADNVGRANSIYIRGRGTTSSTLYTVGHGIVIGSDYWSADDGYRLADREIRSTRHQFNIRTDYVSLEVGIKGSNRQLNDISIVTKPSGVNRVDG